MNIESSWSLILPAHNSAGNIKTSLDEINFHFVQHQIDGQVIIVENGSTDSTWELLESLDKDSYCFQLVTTHSEKGLGNAIREGLRHVLKELVLITADDLPFGFSDLDKFRNLDEAPEIAVGSKSHVNSTGNRSFSRKLMSYVFRILRRLIVGVKLGDTQGSILGKSETICELGAKTDQHGYLMSMELLAQATCEGKQIVELPVMLSMNQRKSNIRILRDSWLMLIGLFAVRKSLSKPSR
jgi:glycosyltransferase involved in cell wall biosynthesis